MQLGVSDIHSTVFQWTNGCGSEQIFNAGIACGIGIDQIEDSYKGQFRNDLEFGQYDFDELYLHEIPDHLVWYIDYEHYAREVMFDHSSESGHYFRNL